MNWVRNEYTYARVAGSIICDLECVVIACEEAYTLSHVYWASCATDVIRIHYGQRGSRLIWQHTCKDMILIKKGGMPFCIYCENCPVYTKPCRQSHMQNTWQGEIHVSWYQVKHTRYPRQLGTQAELSRHSFAVAYVFTHQISSKDSRHNTFNTSKKALLVDQCPWSVCFGTCKLSVCNLLDYNATFNTEDTILWPCSGRFRSCGKDCELVIGMEREIHGIPFHFPYSQTSCDIRLYFMKHIRSIVHIIPYENSGRVTCLGKEHKI